MNTCILKVIESNFFLMPIMQLCYYHHIQLPPGIAQCKHFHTPLPLASSNTVIIVFDFEPFNSTIVTHYFSVFFDLYSL